MKRSIVLNFIASCLAVIGFSISAHAADPFTVLSVPVDATGDSAFEAQTTAIQDGQIRAAQQVLERLTLASERAQRPLPPLSQEVAGKMIRALEIANEKRSANRYLGDISVAFNPREIQAYLQQAGLNMITSQSRPRMVLPFTQGQLDPNSAWYQAWNSPKFSHALTPVNPPSEEQFRFIPRNAQTVLSLSAGELADLARSLNVEQILVVDAYGSGNNLDVRAVDIALDTAQKETLRINPSDFLMAGYETAIVNQLEEDWKRSTVVVAGNAVTMPVSILYGSLSEWQTLKAAIDSSAQIQDARIDAMSKDGALMTVRYAGDLERLQRELAFKSVDLRSDPSMGGMVLTRAGRR